MFLNIGVTRYDLVCTAGVFTSHGEEQESAEGVVVVNVIVDNSLGVETDVDTVPYLQFQDSPVAGTVLVVLSDCVPDGHNPFAVLKHGRVGVGCPVIVSRESEVVDTLHHDCEDTCGGQTNTIHEAVNSMTVLIH